MKIKFITFFFFLSICFVGFSVINLGRFLDITQKPSPSEVIVCLSGDDGDRIKKALELYQKDYSKSHKIILTCPMKMAMKLYDGSICKNKIIYLERGGIPTKDIILINDVHNTMQELLAVKDFLLTNKMKSVLIVSDSPHSRRVVFLANSVAKYDTLDLKITVVGSSGAWWDRDQYYKNKVARSFVILEAIKLPYNYIKYGPLYDVFAKFEILGFGQKYLSSLTGSLKHSFIKFLIE